ncbi:MAG: hypothetical protein AB8F94_14495 [Saprospiraceae bacterium]
MKNILLTIAGILFLSGAYYLGSIKTYVIYRSYPNPYYPIEVKGIGSYLHFANIASTIGGTYRNRETLVSAIVTLESGPNEKGKIEYACNKSSLSQGYFPFANHAKSFAIIMFVLIAIGSWLIRLSFQKE